MGTRALALLRQFEAACTSADELETAVVNAFTAHEDSEIITSFPGLGHLTGARVLPELGDDHTRFATAPALKAYAGSAPITRSSGRKTTVLARHIKNQRLASAGCNWAFAALTASPGARAHYDRRRATEDDTSQHNATCSTACSAACTTASPAESLRRAARLPQHRLTDQPHRMSVSAPLQPGRRPDCTQSMQPSDTGGGIRPGWQSVPDSLYGRLGKFRSVHREEDEPRRAIALLRLPEEVTDTGFIVGSTVV